MKKLLLIGILALCGLMTTGCGYGYVIEEIAHSIDYVYINKSSSQISIATSHSDTQYDGTVIEYDSHLIIPVGEQATYSMMGVGGYPRPLSLLSRYNVKHIDISNGEITITLLSDSPLLLPKTYTTISEMDRHKVVSFVFTDEFFETGEPIEQ
jgi:hypothetical protein